MTTAERIIKRYGAKVAQEHCQRPADGCTLYKCERGHEDCAHTKRGVCIQELAKLVKGAA